MMVSEGTGEAEPVGISAQVAGQLARLLSGAEKTLANAEQLYGEARLLAGGGAIARALALHQFSLEECSKVEQIGVWATSLVLGFAVDQKKLLRGMALHEAKNRLNAFMLEVSQEELAARERGDWDAARALFEAAQDAFHQASNRAKNAALYVNWDGDGFSSPAEQIDAQMLAEVLERNETFLGYAGNRVRTLRALVAAPEKRVALMLALVRDLKAVRAEGGPERYRKSQQLLDRFLEDGLAALSGEGKPA